MMDGVDPRSHDSRDRDADVRDRSTDPAEWFTHDLDLPHGHAREHVHGHDQDYELRGSEVRALAAIGAFRVVAADDLRDDDARPGDLRQGDLRHLKDVGLIQSVAPLVRDRQTTIVTLTRRGRALLEQYRTRDAKSPQAFYAGRLKARELSHDAQVYRAFLRTSERLREQRARILRVVLDTELKREYQRFLQACNRGRADSDGRPGRSPSEVKSWAIEHDLPVVDGRVQFPDVQIQYERSDGPRGVENVEVMTWHYRGAHAAGKAAAGFTRFRGHSMRVGGSKSRGGGSPFDPHAAEELL
jgi:hypothetical protein